MDTELRNDSSLSLDFDQEIDLQIHLPCIELSEPRLDPRDMLQVPIRLESMNSEQLGELQRFLEEIESVRRQIVAQSADRIQNVRMCQKKKLKIMRAVRKGMCSICQCDIGRGCKVVKMQCRHMHHRQCMKKWLGYSESCPLCRSNID